jgi:hypothetical protein
MCHRRVALEDGVPAGALLRLLPAVVEQRRLDEVELDQLVERARQANASGRPASQPVTGDEPLASAAVRGGEEIRRAVAAAESRLIRRAIEAARRAQQQRLFASLGRR